MKSAVWRGAVTRYVLPHLRGDWDVRSTLAYRLPVGWVLTGVGMVTSQFGGHFWHELVAQPLFVPSRGWQPLGTRVGHGRPGGEQSRDFDTVTDGENAMRLLVDQLADGGLETLERLDTVDGLLGEYERRAQHDPDNVHWWEAVAGLAALRDDRDLVVAAGQAADAAAELDRRPWVAAVRDRVRSVVDLYVEDPARAVDELSRRALQTRRAVVGR